MPIIGWEDFLEGGSAISPFLRHSREDGNP